MAIAIDGPSGAGKSTIAKAVAKELGYIYVDTGALYRTIGLYAMEKGVDTTDGDGIAFILHEINLELTYIKGAQRVILNDRDVSEEIRRPEMGMAASNVSAIPRVREFLLDMQRSMAREHDVVMDGRDIGTVVLPDAKIKIFLTASVEERARRRYDEHIARGENVCYEDILSDMRRRDYNDTNRASAPLRQADGAVLLDTTGNTLEQSISRILDMIKEHKPE